VLVALGSVRQVASRSGVEASAWGAWREGGCGERGRAILSTPEAAFTG
jgi:hypothetical protein